MTRIEKNIEKRPATAISMISKYFLKSYNIQYVGTTYDFILIKVSRKVVKRIKKMSRGQRDKTYDFNVNMKPLTH